MKSVEKSTKKPLHIISFHFSYDNIIITKKKEKKENMFFLKLLFSSNITSSQNRSEVGKVKEKVLQNLPCLPEYNYGAREFSKATPTPFFQSSNIIFFPPSPPPSHSYHPVFKRPSLNFSAHTLKGVFNRAERKKRGLFKQRAQENPFLIHIA